MKLKIGIQEFSPLTIKKSDGWSGFEVDLWEEVAQRLSIKFTYENEENLPKLLEKTKNGEYDLSLAGITRTVDRDTFLDMSFHTLDTGLIIGTKGTSTISIKTLVGNLFSKSVLSILFILIIFAAVISLGYWLIEGGHSVSENFLIGISDSFWWAVVTFSTVGYGDIYPITILGKVYGVVSILTGLGIFGLYIAQLSASLTLHKLKHKINSKDDIAGMNVAVKSNTTSKVVALSLGARVQEFETVEKAVEVMMDGGVAAVIADAPVLQNIRSFPDMVLVGGIFSRQNYAFIMPKKNSGLLKKINRTLISLREDGTYDQLFDKYFK